MYMDSPDAQPGAHRNIGGAWSQVAALVAAVEGSLGKWLVEKHGMGLTEYRAAVHLSAASDKELRISDLAHKVGLNQSSVTRLVGRMESKELAFRDTCPDDGRGVFAVLTDNGLTAIKEIRGPYEAKIQELLHDAAKQYPELDLVDLDTSFAAIGGLM